MTKVYLETNRLTKQEAKLAHYNLYVVTVIVGALAIFGGF